MGLRIRENDYYGFASQFAGLNPKISDNIETARKILVAGTEEGSTTTNFAYSRIPWNPPWISTKWTDTIIFFINFLWEK